MLTGDIQIDQQDLFECQVNSNLVCTFFAVPDTTDSRFAISILSEPAVSHRATCQSTVTKVSSTRITNHQADPTHCSPAVATLAAVAVQTMGAALTSDYCVDSDVAAETVSALR